MDNLDNKHLDIMMEKINNIRTELYELALTHKISSEKLIKVSQDLDKHILEY
jgi:Spo0E like sporulation regulatory protein